MAQGKINVFYSESYSLVVERDALRKMMLLRWSVGAVGAGSVPGGAVASPTCDSKILKLPAVANRLQGKPSAAESRGVGAATPTCDSKSLNVGYRNHSRVRERKAPGRAPADGAAGIALGRAGVWGSAPNYFQM